MSRYVVGFAYNTIGQVLLIEKNRPDWQKGMLNGVGGHIEHGESPVKAMRREFLEEAGVDIPENKWECFCVMYVGDIFLSFYVAKKVVDVVEQKTDEKLRWINPDNLPSNVVYNLKWLIPLSQDGSNFKAICNKV